MIAARAVVKDDPAERLAPSEQMLLRFRNGDPEAFAFVVREYQASVYGYLFRCGVDASARDDLFQDIFLRVHRGAAGYQLDRSFKPWLFTIAVNTVRSYFRKCRVRKLVYCDQEATDLNPNGEQVAEARETAEWLEAAIAGLPEAQREVVGLVCAEHMKQSEAAEVLRIPLSTVKTLLRRARIALAQQLGRRKVSLAREVGSQVS